MTHFVYSQRGLTTLDCAKMFLRMHGRVSIIWDRIPKKHVKELKEILKDCSVEFVPEKITFSTIIPEHFDYIQNKEAK
jgi:hypothetical protein